jgi:hypothetical protein
MCMDSHLTIIGRNYNLIMNYLSCQTVTISNAKTILRERLENTYSIHIHMVIEILETLNSKENSIEGFNRGKIHDILVSLCEN